MSSASATRLDRSPSSGDGRRGERERDERRRTKPQVRGTDGSATAGVRGERGGRRSFRGQAPTDPAAPWLAELRRARRVDGALTPAPHVDFSDEAPERARVGLPSAPYDARRFAARMDARAPEFAADTAVADRSPPSADGRCGAREVDELRRIQREWRRAGAGGRGERAAPCSFAVERRRTLAVRGSSPPSAPAGLSAAPRVPRGFAARTDALAPESSASATGH